jgi:hypothetical protein
MKPTRRVAAFVLLATIVGACTGATEQPNRTPSGDTGSETATVSVPPGTGLYKYVNAGLTATLTLKGTTSQLTGTLGIQNKTGRVLPQPAFYVLDARDGHRIDGSVEGSTDVPDGHTQTFQVTFDGLELKNLGLVVLIMGHDNYGAFVQQ